MVQLVLRLFFYDIPIVQCNPLIEIIDTFILVNCYSLDIDMRELCIGHDKRYGQSYSGLGGTRLERRIRINLEEKRRLLQSTTLSVVQ